MAPSLIDSHIHLWPEDASNENGHSWMTPGMPLAKQHILPDYYESARLDSDTTPEVKGVVYVETDRRYDSPSEDLATWAKGPLDEVRFVRDIVKGRYGEKDSAMLLGIVLWAPMNQLPAIFQRWLTLAEETAGPDTWKKVKGFRFLLQAIHDREKFQSLVLGEDFRTNLKILGERGFSFDVGVDQHSGGAWQLELMFMAMQRAHEGVDASQKVSFIVNHLCKPDFALSTIANKEEPDYYRWKQALEKMSHCAKTYMKLSGACSELPERLSATDNLVQHILPWVTHALKVFGPNRVMFGSDWPVCNVNGPSDESAWVVWTRTVEQLLDMLVPEVEQRAYVWSKTAAEAYNLR